MALLPDSPAINAGDNTGAPATDQRGFPRLADPNIDIGAFELETAAEPLGGQKNGLARGAFLFAPAAASLLLPSAGSALTLTSLMLPGGTGLVLSGNGPLAPAALLTSPQGGGMEGAGATREGLTLVLHDVPAEATMTEGETFTFTAWGGYDDRPAAGLSFALQPGQTSRSARRSIRIPACSLGRRRRTRRRASTPSACASATAPTLPSIWSRSG